MRTSTDADGSRSPRSKSLMVLGSQCAVDWGTLSSLPKFRYLRETTPKFTFLTPDECDRLLAAAPEGRLRTMLLVALHAGLRLGELLGLHWEDIDLGRRMLTVRRTLVHGELGPPKNNRERHIPLTDRVCEALADLAGERVGFVFRKANGQPMCTSGAGSAIRRICAQAGIRHVGWHVLRHTFASHLSTRGVTLQCIRDLLGHADTRMTLRYAHLGPSALRDAVAVLDTARPPESSGQPAGNASEPPERQAPQIRSTEPLLAVAQL